MNIYLPNRFSERATNIKNAISDNIIEQPNWRTYEIYTV